MHLIYMYLKIPEFFVSQFDKINTAYSLHPNKHKLFAILRVFIYVIIVSDLYTVLCVL